MKINNYDGYTNEYKFQEGVLTCLEALVEEIRELKELLQPKEVEAVVEPASEILKEVSKEVVEKKPRAKRKTKTEVI